MPSLLLC